MNADKVAMRIQQQVSGIRVEALMRGTASLTQEERDQVSRITGGRVVFEKEV